MLKPVETVAAAAAETAAESVAAESAAGHSYVDAAELVQVVAGSIPFAEGAAST